MRTGIVLATITTSGAPVYAQTSASTTPASSDQLRRARDAWSNGDFDLAPALYEKALEAGHLTRAETVEAYVHVGAALAIGGRSRGAIAAFRKAALLDPAFDVPPEAGKKANLAAEKARRAQLHGGSLTIVAQVGDEVKSGAPFSVLVTLSPAPTPLVDSVAFQARDSLAGRSYEQVVPLPADGSVRFDVPTRVTLPDASLVVRVEARDVHGNELTSVEKHVHVARAREPAPAPLVLSPPTPGGDRRVAQGSSHEGGGGFWSTAWPYVIGGAALAAGGATAWFLTRPTADVNVGAVRVELSH